MSADDWRVGIPKDPVKRARLARMAGLTEEEEAVLNEWCAERQRLDEARARARKIAGALRGES